MIGALAYFLTALLMHPVHETVSEMEWNPQTQRVEIAIRLSIWDEQWIQQRHAKAGEADSHKLWAMRYLQSKYQVDPEQDANDGKQTEKRKESKNRDKYHWVGREEDGAHVWWYFEIQPKSRQQPKRVRQQMFFERNENYINRILILDPSGRYAITTNERKPVQPIKNPR